MTTYEYEVTYKKHGEQNYAHVRAANKHDACIKLCELLGDVTIISVSRFGN